MSRMDERLGVRVIDLGQRAFRTSALWPFDRRTTGSLAATGLHIAVLVALTWSPVGELRSLAGGRPGETWITLAPNDIGIVTKQELDKPAVVADVLRNLEQPASPLADPAIQSKQVSASSEEIDVATSASDQISGAMAPALGTSATSRPGMGGVDDPFAGVAPPGGFAAPVALEAPQPDVSGKEPSTPPVDEEALANLKTSILQDLLVRPRLSDEALRIQLLVHIDGSGVVLDAHVINTELPPNIATQVIHTMRGQRFFLMGESQSSWQPLSLEF